MAIDLDYIVNLSDEDLAKLNRKQIIYRLKKANTIAIDRRDEALRYLSENPNTPTPLIYKKYSKTVKPRGNAIDWLNYEFDFENGESLNSLRHKLRVTRTFLKSKTSSVQGWLDTLQDLTLKLAEGLGVEVNLEDLKGIRYKRLWRVYNKVIEKHPMAGEQGYASTQLRNLIFSTMQEKKYRGYGVDRLTEVIEERLLEDTDTYLSEEELDNYRELIEQVYGGLGRQG